MSTIEGISDEVQKPGVVGRPLDINVPGTVGIGVLGEGGTSYPSPFGDVAPFAGRRAIGVMGTSAGPYGTGVRGESTGGGTGVYGRSEGGGLAGQFDGNVWVTRNLETTGSLTVWGDIETKGNMSVAGTLIIQGVNIQVWLQRIIALEREVASLRNQLTSHLQQHPTGSGGVTTANPVISIAREDNTNTSSIEFRLNGSQFTPSRSVYVRGRRVDNDAVIFERSLDCDVAGQFNFLFPLPALTPQVEYKFDAKDVISGKLSSTVLVRA